jgi:hypothetical protein
MRASRIAIPSAILLGGLLICSSPMFSTSEYAKKEKKACTVCHAKVVGDKGEMTKNLTSTGTCYKDNDHSMAKCAAPKK